MSSQSRREFIGGLKVRTFSWGHLGSSRGQCHHRVLGGRWEGVRQEAGDTMLPALRTEPSIYVCYTYTFIHIKYQETWGPGVAEPLLV